MYGSKAGSRRTAVDGSRWRASRRPRSGRAPSSPRRGPRRRGRRATRSACAAARRPGRPTSARARPSSCRGRRSSWRSMTAPIASSLGSGMSRPSHARGSTKVTFRPSSGPKHRRPRLAAGLRNVPQLEVTRSAKAGLPRCFASASPSAARVIGVSVSTSPIPSWRASISSRGHLEVAEPERAHPVDPRAEGADQLRQLVGGDQVQRPAHRPGLDQRPVAPQGVADVVPGHPVDAGMDRQLGRADDLRLDGDVVRTTSSIRRAARASRGAGAAAAAPRCAPRWWSRALPSRYPPKSPDPGK